MEKKILPIKCPKCGKIVLPSINDTISKKIDAAMEAVGLIMLPHVDVCYNCDCGFRMHESVTASGDVLSYSVAY